MYLFLFVFPSLEHTRGNADPLLGIYGFNGPAQWTKDHLYANLG